MCKWCFILLCLLGGCLCGCSQVRPVDPNKPPPPPPPETHYVGTIQPFLITSGEEHEWSDLRIAKGKEYVEAAMAEPGISILWEEPILYEWPELYDIDTLSEWLQLSAVSRQWEMTRSTLPIYLCHKIPYCDCSGLAALPNNKWGFGHGIAVACYRGTDSTEFTHQSVWPHELGHALGLVHVWENPAMKGMCPSAYACDDPYCYCNMMSYCDRPMPVGVCLNAAFAAQQEEDMRAWLTVPPRSWTFTSTEKKATTNTFSPVYTDRVTPTPSTGD